MVKVINHWSKLLRKLWSLHLWMSPHQTRDVFLEGRQTEIMGLGWNGASVYGLQHTEGHTGANVKRLETLTWWENAGIGKIWGWAHVRHSMKNPSLKAALFGEWPRCHQRHYVVLSGVQMGAEPSMWQPFGPVFGVCWGGHWAGAAPKILSSRRMASAQGAQHEGFGKGARIEEKMRKLPGKGSTLQYGA